ncbi:SsrA-binding protein SmpB [Dyadobacter tibetensis]|uniref:SsrA-binding protein SmpB n=1 Tax=Dyadobacter tibetensis TaxID=1211851 RepID=UPI0004715A85|nr:SsrA-binding protein SmpB [Dyadobacter tibetensis]
MAEKLVKQVNIKNRRASFEYFFLEEYTAGIALTGTEVKSIRQGKVNFQDSYCLLMEGELFVRSLHISPYTEGTHYNHEPMRDRKLLVTRREIKKITESMKDQGLTIIPVRMFTTERGLVKLHIALAKGKKLYDKRDSIKERDVKRETDRMRF